MSHQNGVRIIHGGSSESGAMVAETRRAMEITAKPNCLTFNDAEQVRSLFSELIGEKVDDSFLLIPPFTPQVGLPCTWGAMYSSIRTAPSMTLVALISRTRW